MYYADHLDNIIVFYEDDPVVTDPESIQLGFILDCVKWADVHPITIFIGKAFHRVTQTLSHLIWKTFESLPCRGG